MDYLLSRIPLYLSYYLNVTDEHSLHAPFIYKLYTQVIKGKKQPEPAIESFRNQLLQSGETIDYHTFGRQSSLGRKSRTRIASIARSGINNVGNSSLFIRLIKYFKCETIVELGTSLGINTAYLALANSNTQVYTFEGHNQLITKAKTIFNALGLNNIEIIEGNIDDTLDDFLKGVQKLDFILIDANHRKSSIINYYSAFIPKVHENSVMVIDDIRWNKEMYEVWKDIKARDEVSLSVDLMDLGLLFFNNGMKRQHYTLKK